MNAGAKEKRMEREKRKKDKIHIRTVNDKTFRPITRSRCRRLRRLLKAKHAENVYPRYQELSVCVFIDGRIAYTLYTIQPRLAVCQVYA